MTDLHGEAARLNGLVENYASTVAGVEHALVFSTDGLPIARSARLGTDDADRLATVAAATIGLAEGATQGSGVGAVREVMMVMEQSYLFVTRVGSGAALAVLTSASADVDLIGYEMGLLVERSGAVLTPELRQHLAAQGASA
ncbi:MAG: roadblock/LC7 domain-containing protein [Acidimicrobiia bacterium]|nr:roadblock/LC7 domain-containing protein [Acidimicrobiia bacterium]